MGADESGAAGDEVVHGIVLGVYGVLICGWIGIIFRGVRYLREILWINPLFGCISLYAMSTNTSSSYLSVVRR